LLQTKISCFISLPILSVVVLMMNKLFVMNQLVLNGEIRRMSNIKKPSMFFKLFNIKQICLMPEMQNSECLKKFTLVSKTMTGLNPFYVSDIHLNNKRVD